MNQAVPVFRHQFLSTTSGAAANLTSSAIPMRGNKAAVSVTIINVTSAGATLTAQVQGSYDGLAWEAISGLSAGGGAFGHYDASVGSNDYAYIRVSATLAGTNVNVLFDATIATSEQ